MVLLNTRSVCNKGTLLHEYVKEKDLAMCCITETWLRPGDDSVIDDLCPEGYSYVGQPRQAGSATRGGGFGIVYKTGLHLHQQPCPVDNITSFEVLSITMKDDDPLSLFLVYRPPPSHKNRLTTAQFLQEIQLFLAAVSAIQHHVCVLGDFNLHMDDPADSSSKQFSALLQSFGLSQLVTAPTHRSSHILDLVLTREEENIVQYIGVQDDGISDHYTVECHIQLQAREQTRSVVHCRKLRHINTNSFAADLSTALESAFQNSDVADFASVYNQTVTKVLDNHAPVQTIKRKQVPYKPWYTDEIHVARRKRRQLERRFRKAPIEINRQMFLEHRHTVVKMIDEAKKSYYKKKLSESSPRDTFRVVDELLNPGTSKALPSAHSSQSLANKFMTYFTSKVAKIRADLDSTHVDTGCLQEHGNPLSPPRMDALEEITPEEVSKIIQRSPTKSCDLDPLPTRLLKDPIVLSSLVPYITAIINHSIVSASVPQCFKQANILPYLKKPGLDVEDMKNYRPVSNLSFLSKVLERVIAKQLVQHMSTHQLHDPLQSAYKAAHSTETALLKIKNDIDMALDRGQGVLLLLLDLSAAFDALDHTVLLERLESEVGIQGKALDWFKSYLSVRKQCVTVKGTLSDPSELTVGVPQGSVLGPLLFLVYVLPLRRIIDSFQVNRHGYADDSQLYEYFTLSDNSSLGRAIAQLENCAAAVRVWMIANKLKLNDSKTEFLIVAPKHHLPRILHRKPSITIGNECISPSNTVQNLGATFDSTMSMEAHTNKVVRNIFFHIRRIGKIRGHLDHETAAKVIQALVTSRLDINNALLAGTTQANIHRLQVAQNTSARLLTRTRRTEHISPVLRGLHWLPVDKRILFKVLVQVYKSLNADSYPVYLRDLIQDYKPSRSLRSGSSQQLCVPRSHNIYGDRAFARFAPVAWNALPQELKTVVHLSSFKKFLKTHLF